MAITRANVESELVKRLGKILAEIGLDATTVNGTNADLNGPIRVALRQLGYAVASFTNVSDSDLANVTDDEQEELIDRAELRALRNMLGNWARVDNTTGPRSDSYSQLGTQLRQMIADKVSQITADYEVSNGLVGGVLSYVIDEPLPDEGA